MPDDALTVLKGTLEFLALRTLAGGEEMHGFQILEWMHSATREDLQVEEGALYPALHRMEKRGWLAAHWGTSERGRRAKYYRLTEAGRRALEFLALRTLASGEEMHGFQILEWMHSATREDLQVEEGALYPALHRMEKRGWLAARWGISERGRRAKYYRLTEAGRRALEEEEGRWERYVTAVERIGRPQEM